MSSFQLALHNEYISHDTTQTGSPHQNGKVERLNQTIQNQLIKQLALKYNNLTVTQINTKLKTFIKYYNYEKYHSTLKKIPYEVIINFTKYGIINEQKDIIDINIYKNFATDIEQIFHVETKYLKYIQNRSDQLDGYFNKFKNEWHNIQQLISDRVNAYGSWAEKAKIVLEKDEINDLLATRDRQKYSIDNKDSKNSWV